MKHLRIIFSCLALLVWTSGSMAVTTVKFTGKNITADKVCIVLPGDTLRGVGEAPVVFSFNKSFAGYCTLKTGSSQKLLYVSDGTLEVRYERDRSTMASPYHFSGQNALENEYLTRHESARIVLPQPLHADGSLSKMLDDSLRACSERVGGMASLSADFRKMETQRQQYALLGTFYKRAGWDTTSLPDVTKWMEELPSLWMSTAYKSFFLDALYAIGCRVGNDIHGYTLHELQYVVENMKVNVMRNAVLAHVMEMYMRQRGADESDDLMSVFLSAVSDPNVKRKITVCMADWEKVRKGKAIPDFSFLDVDGKKVSLSDFRGKYVLIDCWATWCGPCKAQLPHIQKFEHEFAGKDIVFVGLSSDKDREKWKKMVVERQMGGIQVNEPDVNASFFRLFQVSAIPRFILLSPDGTVYDAHLPRPSDPAFASMLRNLL